LYLVSCNLVISPASLYLNLLFVIIPELKSLIGKVLLMQVTKTKLPKGQAELQIELSSEEVENYFKKTTQQISQETRIDGFRPGKVPEEVIRKKLGEDGIMAQAAELMIDATLYDALEQENLVMIASPKISIIKQAKGNPFIYKATISLLPEVKLGDYQSIKLKKKPVKVEEEQVKKVMEDLRKFRRKEILVNREVRKGDKVEVDIDVYQNKIPIDGGMAKNQPIEIGEGHFIPGFEDKLIGMKKGETKEFELKFPKEYFQKNLAGKPAEFKAKINSVFELKLPALNDELAKALGNFSSVKELEEQIRKNLEQEAENKEKQRLELELLEAIAKKSEFGEFPDLLIESELDKMIHELKHDFEHQGLKFEDYLTSVKKSEEDLRKSFLPRAEKRVKTALIIRQIAQAEKIAATDQEIDSELNKSREAQKGNEEMLKQIDLPDYRSFVKNVITNQKVIDQLFKLAVEE